jgi:GNAT superfamily N-acetyltransferase
MIIRTATLADISSIHALIAELAEFEKEPQEFILSKEQLEKDGFGPTPHYICFVAEINKEIKGISFCYTRYSTWKGRVLYLEDLIVTESERGKGIGKALFLHSRKYAKENGFYRMQWQVLDWNQSAIDFYKSFDAQFDAQWLNAWVNF